MEDTGFKRKKVEAMTLGEKIRKLRSEYRMSFTEVSRATKIPVKYLEYLERAEYEKLPADVYVRGYLRSYARHLGLSDETLIKLYEKEQHINKNLGRERTVAGIRPRVPLSGTGFSVTSKEVIIASSAIVLFVIGVYLYREFRAFVSDPYLIVMEPLNESVISTSELRLSGKADARAVVSINDTPVSVESDGSFREDLVLHPGQNTIVVVARNRFEKEKKVVLSVRADTVSNAVSLSDPLPTDAVQKEKTFPIELSVRGEGTRVTVEVDGALVYSGFLEEKSPRQFDGVKRVKIRSENGSATFVRVGSNPVESLSSTPGMAEKEFVPPNL